MIDNFLARIRSVLKSLKIIQFGYFIAINMITTGFGALILVPAAIRLLRKQVANCK